jgi:hypothetical protein
MLGVTENVYAPGDRFWAMHPSRNAAGTPRTVA